MATKTNLRSGKNYSPRSPGQDSRKLGGPVNSQPMWLEGGQNLAVHAAAVAGAHAACTAGGQSAVHSKSPEQPCYTVFSAFLVFCLA